MRHTQQGKLWADTLVVLLGPVLCLALLGFLFFASRSHVHRPDWDAGQKAQFSALNAAVELFANEFEGYPLSDANDPAGRPYCGSMKLAEALIGHDLQGFHTRSAYRIDGMDPNGLMQLYPPTPGRANLRARKGPFLQAENANAWRLVDIYDEGNTGPFPESALVLCDTYVKKRRSGRRTGMPILYYRADPSGTTHDVNHPDNLENIYTYKDNEALLLLGVPGKPARTHPLADPKRFYLNTESSQIFLKPRPYRADTFILISAGPDGLYGTADDICNFE